SSNSFLLALSCSCPFLYNDTPTSEIYTLSLHDALPILAMQLLEAYAQEGYREVLVVYNRFRSAMQQFVTTLRLLPMSAHPSAERSEEHTSELQSLTNLVCRLLLEKKKTHTLQLQQHNTA